MTHTIIHSFLTQFIEVCIQSKRKEKRRERQFFHLNIKTRHTYSRKKCLRRKQKKNDEEKKEITNCSRNRK